MPFLENHGVQKNGRFYGLIVHTFLKRRVFV